MVKRIVNNKEELYHRYKRIKKFFYYHLQRHLDKSTDFTTIIPGQRQEGFSYHIQRVLSKGSYGLVFQGQMVPDSGSVEIGRSRRGSSKNQKDFKQLS